MLQWPNGYVSFFAPTRVSGSIPWFRDKGEKGKKKREQLYGKNKNYGGVW